MIMTQLQFRFSILSEFKGVSLFLHNFCLNQIPKSSASHDTLAALVCGKNFQSLSDTQFYASTGLIHLFVVSGSHLLLIQKVLYKIKLNGVLLFAFLLVYCAMCLFNPPVTRSFIFLFLYLMLSRNHQYWPKHYLLLLSGLITICLNFEWVTSLSLQMSWMAALVLEIYATKFKDYSVFFRQIIFYSLFTVCFMGLGFPQFSTIILCVILTPLLEFILFPFAILTVIFHPLEPLFTSLLIGLNTLLKALEFSSRPSHLDIPTVSYMNWILIFLIHFILFFRKPRS